MLQSLKHLIKWSQFYFKLYRIKYSLLNCVQESHELLYENEISLISWIMCKLTYLGYCTNRSTPFQHRLMGF